MRDIDIQTRPALQAAVCALEAAALPVEDLTDGHMAHFYFVGPPEKPTGLVGVELCGDGALLRSLVVDPELRGTGMGRLLVERAECHARTHGASSMFLLTSTAETFFRHLGYASADRASAPPEIRATREFASICPASS